MTLLSNVRKGVIKGVGKGVNPLEDATRDGPRNYRVPVSSAEFSIINTSVPDYLWLCNEASGDLETTIGSLTLTSNGAGTHLYQQAITGWTRQAVGSTADGDVCAWRSLSGSQPDPGSESVAWIGYFQLPSLPGGNRIFLTVSHGGGAGTTMSAQLRTTGVLRLNCGSNNTDGQYNYVDGLVHPIAIVYNRTAETATIYTDQEKITGVYTSAVVQDTCGLGQVVGGTTCVYRCLWLAAYAGSNAERTWRDVLSILGWSPQYA